MRMLPDKALRALLLACKDGSFEAAQDAIEDLDYWLTTLHRRMPDGMSVVAGLVAEGYCVIQGDRP